YEQAGQEYLIYGIGRVSEIEDIEKAVVKPRNGMPVRILDVADVTIGSAVKRGDGSINSQPAVVMGIRKQPDINTLALTQRIDGVLDDIEAGLPEGVELHRSLLRQADF